MSLPLSTVSVPTNFGEHLLGSDGNNDLTLIAAGGATLKANSVVICSNSPVVTRIIKDSGLPFVDLGEFSEEAVRRFLLCCYTGTTTDRISREIFRELNKLAKTLNVDWLKEACVEFYKRMSDALTADSVEEVQFLFREADYVLKQTESFMEDAKDTRLQLTLQESLKKKTKLKRIFLESFVRNDINQSHKSFVDFCFHISGSAADALYKSLTESIKARKDETGAVSMTVNERELLEGTYFIAKCRSINKAVYTELLEILGESNDRDLLREVTNLSRQVPKVRLHSDDDDSEDDAENSDDMEFTTDPAQWMLWNVSTDMIWVNKMFEVPEVKNENILRRLGLQLTCEESGGMVMRGGLEMKETEGVEVVITGITKRINYFLDLVYRAIGKPEDDILENITTEEGWLQKLLSKPEFEKEKLKWKYGVKFSWKKNEQKKDGMVHLYFGGTKENVRYLLLVLYQSLGRPLSG